MYRLGILTSSLAARWAFSGILPSLPTPGSKFFEDFCRTLQPYGLEARNYTLDVPTSRLGDVVLSVLLTEDRIALRLSYEYLELSVQETWEGYEQVLQEVAENALTLTKQHSETNLERVLINTRFHAQLHGGTADNYLDEHLRSPEPDAEEDTFLPDGFAFNVVGNGTKRLTVSKSLVHPGAVFIEINCEYSSPEQPSATAERFEKDSLRLLRAVGLDIISDREADDA